MTFNLKSVVWTIALLLCGYSIHAQKKFADLANKMAITPPKTNASNTLPFNFSVQPDGSQFSIPALHSYAFANYGGLWIFIGGKTNGFHGRPSYPVPFQTTTASNAIWVVDPVNRQSWSVPIPPAYALYLVNTNSAFYQLNDNLYACGGYNRSDTTQAHFNNTSDHFFEFNLPALIQYVKSGGSAPVLTQVVTKVIASPFLQVTGGTLLYNNGNFYLVGGQKYSAIYSSGTTGAYTNAIRKFQLQQTGNTWGITDTLSLIDTINLHRRDMNVVALPPASGSQAVIYGGVFTNTGSAYLNPVEISGLDTGTPTIMVDSLKQMANQYSSANAPIWFNTSGLSFNVFFGGISYEFYDSGQGGVVIGDHGRAMPFSNLISLVYHYKNYSPFELVQVPPAAPLMPTFLGTDGTFIPLPQYALDSNPEVIDGNKIPDGGGKIGYLYGGILSAGPSSGTTLKGNVPTSANPVLYDVYINFPIGN